jgi:hypothetical protein
MDVQFSDFRRKLFWRIVDKRECVREDHRHQDLDGLHMWPILKRIFFG